ncbi:heavy metal-associated isoprenylated plant protein 47-like [Durio zibethinus]|uniref:Heavy metal-associated isoprenylated plant protein 47-like n=1 Tax=Durio zibethinus TaxID=66656 RepID=A0A6P5ZLL1_DURZI|nr:heavy metal-associated isoprenylated plant protein 47-like [Durio zibethinus]
MKQKVELKVAMKCQKCRTAALKVAAIQEGVNSVALGGEQKDKVVVTGDGFDVVKLTTKLSKKVGYTQIISLAEQK